MDFNINVTNTKIRDENKSAMEIELDDLVEHLQDSTKQPPDSTNPTPVAVGHLIQDSTNPTPVAVGHLIQDSTNPTPVAVGHLIQDSTKQMAAAVHQYDTDMKKEMSMTVVEQEYKVKDTSIITVGKAKQKEFEQMMSMEAPDQILTDAEDNSNYFINMDTDTGANKKECNVKDKPVIEGEKNSLKESLLDDNNISKSTTEEATSVESSEKDTGTPVDETKTISRTITFKRDNSDVIRSIISDLWLAIEKEASGERNSDEAQSCVVMDPDLIIYCKDGSTPVHSLILAAASTFLREMLSGLCPCQREAQKVKLQDFTKSDVLQMIKLMYTGSCVVNESSLLDVSAVLNQFNINNIQIQPITTRIESLPIIASFKSLVHHGDVTNAPGVPDTQDVVTEDDLNASPKRNICHTVVNVKNEIIGEDFALKESKGDANMTEIFANDNAKGSLIKENTVTLEDACAADGSEIQDDKETDVVMRNNNNDEQRVQRGIKPVSDNLNHKHTNFNSVPDLIARPESAFKPITGHLPRPTPLAYRQISDHIPCSESAFQQVSGPIDHSEPSFKPVSDQGIHPSTSAEPNHFHISSPAGGPGANNGLYPTAAAAMEHPQQYFPPYFPAGSYLQPQAPPHFGQFAAAMNMHAHYQNPHLMAYLNPYQMMSHLSSRTFQPPVLYNEDLNNQEDARNTGTDGLGSRAAFDLSGQSVQQEENNFDQNVDAESQDDHSNRNVDVTGDFNSNMSKSVDTVNDLLDSQDEGEGEVTETEISVDHNQDNMETITKINDVDVKSQRNIKQEKTINKRLIEEPKRVQSKKTKLADKQPFCSDDLKLNCCNREMDVKCFMLHCVRIHVKNEMDQAVEQEFRDNRGVCSKCDKKLHDVQSYADHQGVQHRVVIDHIINLPSFEHYKDILHKLKEELEEKNDATSSDEKSDVECIGAFTPHQGHKLKCPLCNRKEMSNSMMLRHIVDAHYYFQLRKKMESDYIKKKYCGCDLEMPTLRFFIRHQAIRHQVLLEVCTPQIAKLLKNARFKTKPVTKQVERPKQAVVKAKHTNEVWISNTAGAGTKVKATTLRQTLKESMNTIYAGVGHTIPKDNKPQDGQTKSQLVKVKDKTVIDPPQSFKSHGKLRITRTRDQNTRPSSRQEIGMELQDARKAPGMVAAGLSRAPHTRTQSSQEAPKKTFTRLDNIAKKGKPKVLPSNHFYCQKCSSVKIGYKVFLSHLSSVHYRRELSKEFGESPSTLKSKPCPICGVEIFGRNFFFHLGSKHLEVLKYATWFKPKETDESTDDTKAMDTNSAAEITKNAHETMQVDEDYLKAADAYDALAAAGTEDEEEVDDPVPDKGVGVEMTEVGIEDPDLMDDVVDSGCIEDKDVDPDYKIGD